MTRLAIAALLVGASAGSGRATGCDLSQVIGYQLIMQKTIEGYMQNGHVVRGYDGCVADRVLVFTDHTGVRCKDVAVAHATLPNAFIFARERGAMRLCVGDDIFDVVPVN